MREILLRWQICVLKLLLLCLFKEWKEKQLGKMLIRQDPRANSLLNRSNEGKFLLNLLSMSTIGPLIINHWFGISVFNNNWWGMLVSKGLDSRRDLKMWLWGRECALSCDLPLSFYRCKWMRMRPAITSIQKEAKVWKAHKIQKVALFCILFSSLSG